jgi:hypothetical protein
MTELYAARCRNSDLIAVVLVDDAGRDKLLKVCRQANALGHVGFNIPTCLKIAWVPPMVVEAALGRTFEESAFVLLEVESPEVLFASLQGHDQAGTDTEMLVTAVSRVRFEMDPSEDADTVKTPELPVFP